MDEETLFQLLMELMEKLSIEVVHKNLHDEEFKIAGGLCKVQGKNILIIDIREPLKEQITLLARTLSGCNLDDLFVPPILRDIIENEL